MKNAAVPMPAGDAGPAAQAGRAGRPLPAGLADPALLPFLTATDEYEAGRALETLVCQNADPLVWSIVKRRWRVSMRPSARMGQTPAERDAEDAHGEALAQLVARLQEHRRRPDDTPIRDFRSYVAVTTYRACDKRLREKYPMRWCLKNRLRYLLNHQPALALWEQESGWVAGLAEWRGGAQRPSKRRAALLYAQSAVPGEAVNGLDPSTLDAAPLVEALFRWLDGPLAFDELVKVIAQTLGVKDAVPCAPSLEDGGADPMERWEDTRMNVAKEVEQRGFLQALWNEVMELPERQRAALLLNLRDEQGRGVLALLPLRGIATIREIAAALNMEALDLAGMWKSLPLDDASIAKGMGLKRQQVINLRKCARERLTRRMRAQEMTDEP